jgi:hypothetical protein
MLQNLNGIAFTELVGSPNKTVGWSSRFGTRVFLVDWGYADAFVLALVGYAADRGPGTALYLNPPEHFPGDPMLVCTSATYEPYGKPGQYSDGTAEYTKAKITATYSTPGYMTGGPDGAQFGENGLCLTETLAFSTEVLSISGGQFYYYNSGVAGDLDSIPGSMMKNIGLITHNIKLENVLRVPTYDIANCLGKINANDWRGMAFWSCLFNSANVEPTIGADGTRTYCVTLQFIERQIGWNQVYRASVLERDPDTEEPIRYGEPLVLDQIVPFPYEETDFSVLLQ